MARPRKCRRICEEPAYNTFVPDGLPSDNPVILSVEEYEAIRLIDYLGLTQEECSQQMEVARTTITEMYDSARKKIADCIVNGRILNINGGYYKTCSEHEYGYGQQGKTIDKNIESLDRKGEGQMRIAVTFEDGQVYQHFGHTKNFKLYDVEDGKIIKSEVIGTDGQGHGALAGLLAEGSVDVLICGGIGGGAQNALADAGVKLYGGVSGACDDAVTALIEGRLDYNPEVKCNHHEEGEHKCGGHHGEAGHEHRCSHAKEDGASHEKGHHCHCK